MELVKNEIYTMRGDHPHHPYRRGRFQFLGGEERNVIVLADLKDERALFAVGMVDLVPPEDPSSAPKQLISVKVYDTGGIDCESDTCKFRRECAIHETAGDYRGEDGFTPILVKEGDQFYCLTFPQKADEYDYPANYDTLGRGSLCIKDGVIVKSKQFE